MSYYNQKKEVIYAQNLYCDFIAPIAEQNKIYKNYYYKQNKGAVVYIDMVGSSISTIFILLERCIREKKEEPKATQGKHCWAENQIPTKFHSYRPVVSSLQYDYFVNGFFNATEEEKIKFGLIFNDLDAYTMCYDAFNEAEAFYASFAR
ncbi:hypothetical protein KLEP7_gp47 [Pseudaeromonas phage vB_PpeM_ KLEP7]|nr:hypothetical protein KLEP7_gp47 [Pseudaeromonas phage vB_PpeM_ KLEP7]